MQTEEHWDLVIKPKNKWYDIDLAALWKYRDLLLLLVRRDFVAVYKQTILGPLWMFIQPIFATLIYTFTFGQANLSTDGIPALLFYLIGQTFWNYFSECLNKTSVTFTANAAVFGKVYFPRLVMPLSVIISNLVKLGIQLLLLTIVFCYFYFSESSMEIQWAFLFLIPFLILLLGVFSLSLGILFSSLTTKYRDFNFLIGFAVQLLMFLSCVVFPASMFKGNIQLLILCNPVAVSLEAIKFIITGHGIFSIQHILISYFVTFFLFLFSLVIFNRTEKSFMDTV